MNEQLKKILKESEELKYFAIEARSQNEAKYMADKARYNYDEGFQRNKYWVILGPAKEIPQKWLKHLKNNNLKYYSGDSKIELGEKLKLRMKFD